MKTVCIVGASGKLGRYMVRHCLDRGYAVPFRQTFFDTEDARIQNGFQLFLQLRFGGHFEFFSRRWFLEPSVAFNYWPVNTNFPASFREVERGKQNYFLGEPGLHFGWKF